uniref:Uncharacterized protein n=1 Tax=viral metagenome TaxID=1070528 RepID=A0A6H1Z840_9ZZZZ
MSEKRIRGQETVLRLLIDGNIQREITAIKDTTVTFQVAILTEGYLGETTMRRDDIFNGLTGSFTVQPEGNEIFTLINSIKERAQRRNQAATPTISMVTRLNFPSGQTVRIVVPELFFGDFSIQIPARDQYVNTPVTWEAEDGSFIGI